MDILDEIMEWAFLMAIVLFVISVPCAVASLLVFNEVHCYEVALTSGMAGFSFALNYALIRIGRASNYHPNKYGANDEVYEEC